jgi:magnesium chelatase family protein
VRAALQNAQFEFPAQITVNLAPADSAEGIGRFDADTAIGILAAMGQIPMTALRRMTPANWHLVAQWGDLARADGVGRARDGRAFVLPASMRSKQHLYATIVSGRDVTLRPRTAGPSIRPASGAKAATGCAPVAYF